MPRNLDMVRTYIQDWEKYKKNRDPLTATGFWKDVVLQNIITHHPPNELEKAFITTIDRFCAGRFLFKGDIEIQDTDSRGQSRKKVIKATDAFKEIFEDLTTSFTVEEYFLYLSRTVSNDTTGRTTYPLLFSLMLTEQFDSIKLLFTRLAEQNLQEFSNLILSRNAMGANVLHCLAEIVSAIPDPDILERMAMNKNEINDIVVDYVKILEFLLNLNEQQNSDTSEEKYDTSLLAKLVSMQGTEGNTPLHTSIQFGNTVLTCAIVNAFDFKETAALAIKNIHQETPHQLLADIFQNVFDNDSVLSIELRNNMLKVFGHLEMCVRYAAESPTPNQRFCG